MSPRLSRLALAAALGLGGCEGYVVDPPDNPYARVPCPAATDWEPNRPLEGQLQSLGADALPDFRTDNFARDVWLRGPDGPVPFEPVSAGPDTVLLCPLGGLEPNTRYTWRFGPFDNPDPQQVPMRRSAEPGVWSFRTAAKAREPGLTAARCREVWREAERTDLGVCDDGPPVGETSTGTPDTGWEWP